MWLSVLGMYEFNNSLFDGLAVPDGIEKNDVVNNILFECAELEIIYPNFEVFKTAINIWSASEQITWNKLYNTMTIEYNPIWNVDANETETETTKATSNKLNDRDINTNFSGSNNETVNMTDTEAVQGFNSSSWADSKKNTKQGSDNIAVTNNEKVNETVTETVADDNERVLTKRRTGNIGVTATQDLISKERSIAEFNMVNYITESFKRRFCLMIY